MILTFGIIGFSVLAYRVPAILAEDRQHVRNDAVSLARYFEQLIDSLEGRLGTLAALNLDMPPAQIQRFLDAVVAEGGFTAIYLLSEHGRVKYVALPENAPNVRPNLVGADLSRNPLFTSARHLARREPPLPSLARVWAR